MDTKDWAAMRQVFADDVVIDTTASGGGVMAGADEFMAFLQGAIGDVVTVHHGHMPEIEVTSATTATGVWAMEDRLRWPDGTEMHGFGHYHETYEKGDRGWRIQSSTLTRLRTDFTPAAAAAAAKDEPRSSGSASTSAIRHGRHHGGRPLRRRARHGGVGRPAGLRQHRRVRAPRLVRRLPAEPAADARRRWRPAPRTSGS